MRIEDFSSTLLRNAGEGMISMSISSPTHGGTMRQGGSDHSEQ
jgi:hypothetical protein